MGWRDQKRVARNIVHETMALPCWRIPFGGGVPVITRGRLHVARVTPNTSAMGDIESTGYAQWEEVHTKIVFKRDEVDVKRNDVFVFAPDEAYLVHPERPFDDQTVTVKVSRMDQTELVTLLATLNPALEFWPASIGVGMWKNENVPTTARKYSATIGDGVSSVFNVVHNLNSQDIIVSVYEALTREGVLCDWVSTGPNTVRLTFRVAPAAGQYRVTIAG